MEQKNVLVQIFANPEDLFISYFLKGKGISFKEVTILHILLWIFAPIFRLFYNIFDIYMASKIWKDHEPSEITNGILISFLIYPIVYILILQIDTIRLYYRSSLNRQIIAHESRNLLLVSFIPFSASFLFWIFPFPFNAVFILFTFFYSVWLSYISMQIASNYKPKQFFEFLLMTFIYFLILALFFNIIFHIYREFF